MIYTEETFPFLINDLMQYIQQIKTVERNLSLIDILVDFSLKKDIPVEVIGEAISTDIYFKSFIQKDCELHGFFKTNIKELDKW